MTAVTPATRNRLADPLATTLPQADRVHYATALLLDAADFEAEQTYHRGRLSRLLTYLLGYGTLAGLRVTWEGPAGNGETVSVHAGMAVDRLGRLIEVQRDACIHLNRWYEGIGDPDVLAEAWHTGDDTGVIVDVFLSFEACASGYSPALAAGQFDALDALTYSRVRDAYHLELVPRREGAPALPAPAWTDLSATEAGEARRTAARESVLDGWRDGPDTWTDDGLAPLQEHAAGQDSTAVFLARLVLPAAEPAAGEKPIRALDRPVVVNNDSRPFILSARLLAGAAGLGL